MHLRNLLGQGIALGHLSGLAFAAASDPECIDGETLVQIQPIAIVSEGPRGRGTSHTTVTR